MAFCQSCGASVEGRFCANCGTPVGDTASGSVAGTPSPSAPATTGLTDNVAGALSYLLGFITGILFLVLEPYNHNKTVRFHAFQSIFLSVAYIVVHIVLSILAPFTLGMTLILSMLVGLASLVLWLFLMWKTYRGQKVVLPVVGPLAEQQA